MSLVPVSGGWVNVPQLYVRDSAYQHLIYAFDREMLNWKRALKKYIWFEHHLEMECGIRCNFQYDFREVSNIQIVDDDKYLLFLLRNG